MLSANKDRTSLSVGGRRLGQTWLVIIIYPRTMRCRVDLAQAPQGPDGQPCIGCIGSPALAGRLADKIANFCDHRGALLPPFLGPCARGGGAYA